MNVLLIIKLLWIIINNIYWAHRNYVPGTDINAFHTQFNCHLILTTTCEVVIISPFYEWENRSTEGTKPYSIKYELQGARSTPRYLKKILYLDRYISATKLVTWVLLTLISCHLPLSSWLFPVLLSVSVTVACMSSFSTAFTIFLNLPPTLTLIVVFHSQSLGFHVPGFCTLTSWGTLGMSMDYNNIDFFLRHL